MVRCPLLRRVPLVITCALVAVAHGDVLRPRPATKASPLLPAEHYVSAVSGMKRTEAKRAKTAKASSKASSGGRADEAAAAPTSLPPTREPRLILLVKFFDSALVRAHGTAVDAQDVRCKQGINQVLDKFKQDGLQLHSVFENVGTELEAFLDRAQKASGNQEADLRGITRIAMPGSDISKMVEVGHALEATHCVEYVSVEFDRVEPPCFQGCNKDQGEEICGETPDFKFRQTYFGPDPGMDVDWAQAQGADGTDMRYSDVEYAILPDHEDLPDVLMGRGDPDADMLEWAGPDHGTASVAIAVGLNNSRGVTGIAPGAEAAFFVEQNTTDTFHNRVEAMFQAFAHSRAGDVVLMEMQVYSPYEPDAEKKFVYLPAETDPSMWDVVKVATDAGVVVVAGAGNGYPDGSGSYDLDGPLYQLPEWRARGDSGAIIVGAGSSDERHEKMDWSGYGSRVDVQAWGENVMTAGYGDCGDRQHETREYTQFFSGTSSASALVAAAATALQSLAKKENHTLTPLEMRELLTSTGTPQDGDNTHKRIGPHVNLRKAIEKFRRQQNESGGSTPATTTTESGGTDCSEVSDDCRETKCCNDPGLTCYEKNEWWAGCKPTCTPGIDPEDPPEHQTPWSCQVLGDCPSQGEDCRDSRCCSDPAMTCFEKDSEWGSCRLTCKPGIDPNDPVEYQTPWSCDFLGRSAPQYLEVHHGMYLTAEMDGSVQADRSMADAWERWTIVPVGSGKVALLSYFGKWLSAEENGELRADRIHLKEWEEFELIHHDSGHISLRSVHGKYVAAEPNGEMKADRHHLGEWEKFTLQPATGSMTLLSQVRETVASFFHTGFTRAPQGALAILTAAGALGALLAVFRRRAGAVGEGYRAGRMEEERDGLLERTQRIMVRGICIREA